MKTSFQEKNLTNNIELHMEEWLWQRRKIIIRQFIREN